MRAHAAVVSDRPAAVVGSAARPPRHRPGHRRPAQPRIPRAVGPPGLRGGQRLGAVGLGGLPGALADHPARRTRRDPARPRRAGRVAGLAPAHLGAAAPGPAGARRAHRGCLRGQVRDRAHRTGVSRGRTSSPSGESYPSGHVANAVLMWGVARWLAVDYGLPAGGPAALLVAQRRRAGRHRAGDGGPGLPLDHRRGRGRRRRRVAAGRGSHTRCTRSVTLRACPRRPPLRLTCGGAVVGPGSWPSGR